MINKDEIEINKRLKELRLELKLSQEKFGKKIGIARNSVCSIEKFKYKVTDTIILNLIRSFGVNELWLRTGKGEMFDNKVKLEIKNLINENEFGEKELNTIKNSIEKFIK